MALKNLKNSLDKISKSLETVQSSREILIKNSREVIILCSKSIISVHKGDLKSAISKAKRAKKLVGKLRIKAREDLRRYLITPEQELVEALSLIAISQGKEIPSIQSMSVLEESYILGLLDCIGELKRLVYDNIRRGELEEAIRIFNVMENLYLYLYPFATFDKIVKEARRKLDVNRILVEDIRAALTEEIRRKELINTINKLQNIKS